MTSRFVPLARIGDLRDGVRLRGRVEGIDVLLIREEGRVWVIEDRCPHAGSPLYRGHYDEGTLWCPRHGYSYDLETGQRVAPPVMGGGCEHLRRFDTEIRDGRVGMLLPA